MTKDDLTKKAAELAADAWGYGYAQGVNETTKAYEAKLAEKEAALKVEFDKGYQQGVRETLASVNISAPTEDEVPDIAKPKIQEYQVENATVRKYLAESYYDGYSQGNGSSKLRPFFGDIVESSTKTSPTELPSADLPKELHNAVPGDKVSVVKEGRAVELRAVGQVRMIELGRIPNARDIGGWPCAGGQIAYGRIIRAAGVLNGEPFGDSLDVLSSDSYEAKELRRLGVTAEFDLRATAARYKSWEGIKFYGTCYNESKKKTSDKYYINGYTSILTSPGNLKTTLTALANVWDKGGCAFVHCHAGADRTGTLVAILQMLCGCPEDAVIKEWEMTSFCAWCNFKLIDYERTGSSFPKGELRTFLREVAKLKGATTQAKIETWLTSKVGCSASLISKIKKNLIR